MHKNLHPKIKVESDFASDTTFDRQRKTGVLVGLIGIKNEV